MKSRETYKTNGGNTEVAAPLPPRALLFLNVWV